MPMSCPYGGSCRSRCSSPHHDPPPRAGREKTSTLKARPRYRQDGAEVVFVQITRCLQISRQLNSAAGFGFPCIPGMSIESKEFHSGYRKSNSVSRKSLQIRDLAESHHLASVAWSEKLLGTISSIESGKSGPCHENYDDKKNRP